MFDLAESLPGEPWRGRRVPEVGREKVRELLDGQYRLIYRIDKDFISILTVWHGRRRWDPQVTDD